MNCSICASEKFSTFSETSYFGLPVYKCNNCKLFFTGNSESIKQKIEEYYRKEFWDIVGSQKALDSDFTDVDSKGKKRQWTSQYKYCKSYLQNKKKFLDIGAGSGQTMFWFEELGFDVVGIEPDARNVEMINKKLRQGKCYSGFIENFIHDKKYDIIWISHVLEHLINPVEFLKKIKNNLNENGIVFIEVPNCSNKTILDLSVYKNPSTFHFTKNTLIRLADMTDYQILRCDIFRSPTLIEGAIQKITKKIKPKIGAYAYYPKIIADDKVGTDIRIILEPN